MTLLHKKTRYLQGDEVLNDTLVSLQKLLADFSKSIKMTAVFRTEGILHLALNMKVVDKARNLIRKEVALLKSNEYGMSEADIHPAMLSFAKALLPGPGRA